MPQQAPVLDGFLPRLPTVEQEYARLQPMFNAVGYTPSPEQRRVHEAILAPGRTPDGGNVPRLVILGGGIQAGKSYLAGYHALARFPMDGTIWLVGFEYEDTIHEFSYLREAAVRLNAATRYSTSQQGPWDLRYVNGATVRTIASKDITKLAGEAPDGIIMCEAGRQTYEAFETCLDRVTPKQGWLLVSGTFEQGSNWYRNLWRECRSPGNIRGGVALSLPSYSNRRFYPDGVHDQTFWERERQMLATRPVDGKERFAERFLGEPRTPSDLVFKDFSRLLHVQEWADFDPAEDVALWIDPGYDPSAFAVLFVQVRGDTICVFDEIYVNRMLNHEIMTMVKNHRAFPNVKRVVMDKAAKQHGNAQQSAFETWSDELSGRNGGISFATSQTGLSVADGIARTHDKLAVNPLTNVPYMVFSPKCRMLAWEMEEGYKFRTRADGLVHSDSPIDENNHAVKALAYGIVDRYGLSNVPGKPLPRNTVETMPWDAAFQRRRSGYASAATTATGRR
ncbi:MAG: hypothetical protein IT318_20275 [Anaerolineales bacterium]|nr:hypothetical protein [Anaerolineales bacterium]